jgi:hypothetical protein
MEQASLTYDLSDLFVSGDASPEGNRNIRRPIDNQRSFEHLRKPETSADRQLSDEAAQLVASFDPSIQPIETAKRYPRIVNRIASLWKKPSRMDDYFEDLMIDRRGNRQGFPLQVAFEIAVLQEHYRTIVFPKNNAHDWNDAYF